MPRNALMIQGTASHVGKSVLVTALCRILHRQGVRVAPFKALNMSNNAWVTDEGGEMAVIQAAQAKACGISPTVEMNPILLKPTTDRTSQVIVCGRPRAEVTASEFPRLREELSEAIQDSFKSLCERYDFVVIEGAGSPAEINLSRWDLANMFVARLFQVPVILVGDIERGGVFAQLVGTLELLSAEDRRRIQGFVINKFRGEFELLEPGLRWLENRTGLPVFGVLPYLHDLNLPEEDAVADRLRDASAPSASDLQIQIIRFPTISNFTDFDPLHREPGVAVRYLSQVPREGMARPDLLILPGSKSTMADLTWMRKQGLDRFVHQCVEERVEVLGICGGFQMLGTTIVDPTHVESDCSAMPGLGLLPTSTLFLPTKVTAQVRGIHLASGQPVRGYEIHAGRIQGIGRGEPVFRLQTRGTEPIDEREGCQRSDRNVWGTFLHGLFDEEGFRRTVLERIRGRVQKPSVPVTKEGHELLDPYDRLADVVQAHLDLNRLKQWIPWTLSV